MSELEEPLISTLAALRADVALTHQFAYFQTGSEGPVPDTTQHLMMRILREENGAALGGPSQYPLLVQRAEGARASMARLLGVAPQEVAWCLNTSSSIRLAVGSLPWKEGDRLAITGSEHISTRILSHGVEQVTGQKTTVIPTGEGQTYSPDAFLAQVEQHLTPDHRLFIISHVSCIDGRRLPVVEATRIAHERGVKVLVDGAQAVGQIPVDVSAIDPEFYAGSVHKWLLGPAGIGYLVVARRQLPEYHPNLMPHPYPEAELRGRERPLTAGGQTEVGTESMSVRMGAGRAAEILGAIGLDAVERHVRQLTVRLREGLRGIRGFNILTPPAWELSSGITSLQFPGRSRGEVERLIDRIWDEYRVMVKLQVEFEGIRISIASFNAQEEVDRLLEALARLVPQM